MYVQKSMLNQLNDFMPPKTNETHFWDVRYNCKLYVQGCNLQMSYRKYVNGICVLVLPDVPEK